MFFRGHSHLEIKTQRQRALRFALKNVDISQHTKTCGSLMNE